MKGILLAGGSGTRLEPLTTQYGNKHLVLIGGKPMIMYPLQNLIDLGCKEVLIITNPENIQKFVDLLGNGSDLGINISYKPQLEPDGILGALSLCENFIGNKEQFALILGDNYFDINLNRVDLDYDKNYLFTKYISKDANRFGCIRNNKIIEKPKDINESFVVTGLYIYVNNYWLKHIKTDYKKSLRGEYEITDLNNKILNGINREFEPKTEKIQLTKDEVWSDMGTMESFERVQKYLEWKNNRPEII